MRARTLTVAVALALLLAGCGARSDEQQVRAVLGDVAAARRDGDAERACERDYAVIEKRKGEERDEREGREACVAALRGVLARDRQTLRSYAERVDAVEVHGDAAHATVRATGRRPDGSAFARDVTYDLVRRDSGWRVAIEAAD